MEATIPSRKLELRYFALKSGQDTVDPYQERTAIPENDLENWSKLDSFRKTTLIKKIRKIFRKQKNTIHSLGVLIFSMNISKRNKKLMPKFTR